MGVSLHCCAAKRGDDFRFLASRPLHTRELLLVALYPLRHVVALTIFPGAEPQKNEAQIALTRSLDCKIDGAKVELTRLWLNRLPINRNLGGIGIWVLGYDKGYADVWDMIEKKFSI